MKKIPKLDLPLQFDIKAEEMLLAVKAGQRLHEAKNIKSSGLPFEQSLRGFLGESLPSTSKVASGYFYGASSQCSSECDILIYEERESFRLDPARQDQHYVPFTSLSAIGQLKNSANDLQKAIKQVQKSMKAFDEMYCYRRELHTKLPEQLIPLTFAICGSSADIENESLVEAIKATGEPQVDYILLLDKGLIITKLNDTLGGPPSEVSFNLRNGSSVYLCKPAKDSRLNKGMALLWFYFALVHKLSQDTGNTLRYQSFCKQIELAYPLVPFQKII